MRSLLLCLLLLGSSWVGTDAFFDDLFGSSDNTTSTSAPLDSPPSHVHGHSPDEESDNEAHYHHHHHHDHDGEEGDVYDQSSHTHRGNEHPHMNEDEDTSPDNTQHDPRLHIHGRRHYNGHRHHGNRHHHHNNHSHNHTHLHHNHTHLHHNHTHLHHNHTRSLPPHQHGRHPHPHHRPHRPHQARDRRIFEFGIPMSLDERRQRNLWDPIIRKTKNGFQSSAGSHYDRKDTHHTPDHPTPNTNSDVPSDPRHTSGNFLPRRPPYPFYTPDTHPHGHQAATPHISPPRYHNPLYRFPPEDVRNPHHEDPHYYGQTYHPRHPPLDLSPPFPLRPFPPPPPPPPRPTLRQKCPMLYSSVGGRCISIFSIARMSWYDAKQFCDGIFGELFTFNHPQEYRNMVVYLRERGLSTPLWVGGRETQSGWVWLDRRIMPLGTPYWAVRPVPFSSGSRTMQCPSKRSDDSLWCAAIQAEDYYYLSDADCDAHKAPLCVLRDDAEVVVATGETNYTYPALDPGFCRNWMVTGQDKDGKGVFDETSEESSSDDEEMSEDESSESQESSEEIEEDEEEEDEEKGAEENEEEGAADENTSEEGKKNTSVPSLGGDEDNEEGASSDNDQETNSGSGSGDGMPEDDEDMEKEGSGLSLWSPPTNDEYDVNDPEDYEAVENFFGNY